jgi:RNA polymerase sigma factor (TIGR02999 family)
LSTLSPRELTQKLQAWSDGNGEALDELLPIVYDELHKQAARYLRRERSDHTLQATALIHEAYLKLVEQKNVRWQNRAHFFGVAAQLMRRILIDYARTRHREKRGGNDIKMSLDEAALLPTDDRSVDLIALDEALTRLAAMDEQQSRIVELKFFGGLNIDEIAEALHISPATVKRDWQMSKAWMHHELNRQ